MRMREEERKRRGGGEERRGGEYNLLKLWSMKSVLFSLK